MKNKKISRNLIISITVQVAYLSVSFLLNLIVPKKLDQYQYAYWQTFVLYLTYVGVLHFGLLDGFLLRYSQYDYDKLDKKLVRSQFCILLSTLTIFAAIVIVGALLFVQGEQKRIIILVCIGIISKNVVTYSSHLYQSSNEIGKYAVLTMLQRLSYGTIVLLLVIFGVPSFEMYCIADLVGDGIAIIYALIKTPHLFVGKYEKFRIAFSEWWKNVSSGCILMLSNWSSMLILGIAKIVIQIKWGELVFGKIALSFSITNLFLSFLIAVSIVLFPALKRMDKEELPSLYNSLRRRLIPFLVTILLFYFPGCWILSSFLPNYIESLDYIRIILPIIIFTSKTNLLTNNYLKAYRMEKKLLAINLVTTLIALVVFSLSAFVFENLNIMLICVVIIFAFNSAIAERCVVKRIQSTCLKHLVVEVMMTAVFILTASLADRMVGLVLYASALVIYFSVLWISKKNKA